jgi:Fe-S-cluster-containing dehydrogenase component/formate-dependent nitrite reductase membrane component NrfD
VQLGFVIDQTRCIGCHACTVACKSENGVPLGDFRTWVKYTEEGSFPEVKRSFTVLRCNQCSYAPCVTICPVTALDKRPDGIVDLDHDICIGCKACMHGCPYDSIYLNEETGTAEKCHFCAHRIEQGLAPACTVVCPTEALIPGDFDDPKSAVSRMHDVFDLSVRKAEAGTGPNVFYREAASAGLDPALTSGAGGYLWSEQLQSPQVEAELHESMEQQAQARTTYSVPRKELWGTKISGYLFFKSLAAGTFLVGSLLLDPLGKQVVNFEQLAAGDVVRAPVLVPLLAMVFLAVTMLLLVADLKRPERFLKIMLRPNWSSWLAKGSFVLMVYGLLLATWLGLGLAGQLVPGVGGWVLWGAGAFFAAFSAGYTAFLFAQAKGRVLWMKRGYFVHLVAQALVAGGGLLLAIFPWLGLADAVALPLGDALFLGLVAHLILTLLEGRLAPVGREREFARALRLLTHGPYAKLHWQLGLGLGVAVPIVLLLVSPGGVAASVAGALALAGLYIEKDCLVRAGQAVPIS